MSGCPYSHQTLPLAGDNSVLSLMGSFGRVMLGNTTEIIHAITRASANTDRTQIQIGPKNFYILKHPDDVNAIFCQHASACPVTHAKSQASSYRPGTKLGNSSIDLETWKGHRAAIAHHISATGLRHNYRKAMHAVLPAIVDWANHESINVNFETTRLALQYAWTGFFTDKISSNDAADIANVGADHIQKFFLLSLATFGKIPVSVVRKMSEVAIFTDMMDSKLNQLLDNRFALEKSKWPEDFLSEVIIKNKLHFDPANKIAKSQVLSELTEILVASYLNTRSAFYWGLHKLAERPDLQQQIREEYTNKNYDTVQKVVMETLRLYPPLYLLPRETNNDITLPGNYNIPEGSHLLAPIWNIHRDPRWFPDPENFNPSINFSDKAERARPADASFIPFGLGRHKCPGYAMATQELMSLLTSICYLYDVTPDPNAPSPYLQASTLLNPENKSRVVTTPRPESSFDIGQESFYLA